MKESETAISVKAPQTPKVCGAFFCLGPFRTGGRGNRTGAGEERRETRQKDFRNEIYRMNEMKKFQIMKCILEYKWNIVKFRVVRLFFLCYTFFIEYICDSGPESIVREQKRVDPFPLNRGGFL